MDLTLLEVSLDDAKITANAPFSGNGGEESDESDDADESTATSIEVETGSVESEGSGGGRAGSAIGFLVAVAVLIGLAALVRRRRSKGGDEESIEVE